MSEIILDYFKALYPYFFIPALAGIVIWRKRRRWKKEHTLLLVLYFSAYAAMIAQIGIADRTLDVSRRYLLPFAPLMFGFTAVFWEYLQKHLPRAIYIALLILLGSFMLLDALNPALKDHLSQRRKERNAEIRQMAAILNKALANTPHLPAKAMWYYEPRLPGRAVIKDAPGVLAYLSGCENYNIYFPHEKFDYLVTPSSAEIPDGQYIVLFSGTHYRLLKPCNPEQKL